MQGVAFDPLSTPELFRIILSPLVILSLISAVVRGLVGESLHRRFGWQPGQHAAKVLFTEAKRGLVVAVQTGVLEEMLFRFLLHPLASFFIFGILRIFPPFASAFQLLRDFYSFFTFGRIDNLIITASKGNEVFGFAVPLADDHAILVR